MAVEINIQITPAYVTEDGELFISVYTASYEFIYKIIGSHSSGTFVIERYAKL